MRRLEYDDSGIWIGIWFEKIGAHFYAYEYGQLFHHPVSNGVFTSLIFVVYFDEVP